MYPQKQSITVTEALKKMEHYCAYQERCHKEVAQKMQTWNLIPEAKEKILLHLMQENYLNEERFARSFARGKFRIKKWGKQRIVKELKFKQISDFNIKTALKEISEQEYTQTFYELVDRFVERNQSLEPSKLKTKLISYLQYRGWESSLIFETVNNLELR
ncbi:RecX family transcriptional regulator [Aquimarina sp. ERC-38]|uniref:regulatory protein RecX n=1 Tax=Aquimarina sp. ERC-38 TaxID=2949996 RepID=UPI0022479AE1|nr:regulatory protein RecX [Aquimarina sp. ERC-38]UZO82075.1 RecX family transcriptional regulator [Aquimarina sp. ERC-38]